MLKRVIYKLSPKISERDRKLVESINSKKTIRVVGGAVYVGAEDVKKEMKELHRKTRHLVAG